MSKPWRLKRRTFLGTAGTAIALPALEVMQPVARAQVDAPRRLMFIHVPNGIIRTRLQPTQEGRGYDLPENLQPLAAFRDDLSVISGLSNKVGLGTYVYPDGTRSEDGPGDHARDVASYLTCARIKKTDGSDIRNGISVDQVAAEHLKDKTPDLPSLELGIRAGYGGDSGYAPIYQSNISWKGPQTPQNKEVDPQAVFNRLFAGFEPTASRAELEMRKRLRTSVLDSVRSDMARLRARVSDRDRLKLEEYEDGVRHLEVRLESTTNQATCAPGTEPGDNLGFEAQLEAMWDLVALAFKCDRTRVATMMLNQSNYGFLNISEGYHSISHHEGNLSNIRKIETINKFQIESFGRLLVRLKAETDIDGQSILHNSLVLFGSSMDGTGSNNPEQPPLKARGGRAHELQHSALCCGCGRRLCLTRSTHHVPQRRAARRPLHCDAPLGRRDSIDFRRRRYPPTNNLAGLSAASTP